MNSRKRKMSSFKCSRYLDIIFLEEPKFIEALPFAFFTVILPSCYINLPPAETKT